MCAAYALETPFFENAQKFCLNRERQLSDFVEEESAAMSEIHFAGFARAGSREGAAFVAEEFVFDEAFGNGGAV